MTDRRMDQWRTSSRRRQRARRVGSLAALVGLAAALQLGPAQAADVEGPATVTREAYFTNPITQSTPPLLRNGFPPGTACLVAGVVGVPQVCGTEVQQIAALLGLTDGLPIPITPDGDLAQPSAVPGTTPVGMFGGQQRYASLQQIALPALPAGERFGSFELVLHQDGLNFAIESPALRDLVLQIVSQIQEQDPQLVADALTRALSGEVPLATETITGIEACPIIEPWAGGPAQGGGLDGTRVPDANCTTGTTGTFDPATETWVFDITFAVQAWTEGDGGTPLPNEGLIFRPVGAPNLAYGDPDLSTNWQVSLADSSNADPAKRPMIRYTTVSDESGAVDDSGDFTGGDVPLPDAGGSFDVPPAIDTGTGSGSGTGSAGGGEVAAPQVPVDGRPVRTDGSHTPGWVWVALPLGAIGATMFSQSLDASPAGARRRPGALSRLEAEQP